MKFLVHIGHPAHVHLFKNLVMELEKKGHRIILTAIDKEITITLLEKYGLEYFLVGKNQRGLFRKFKNLVGTEKEIYKIAKKHEPDILLGVAAIPLSHIGKLLGIKSIILDDTEHSNLEIILYRHFASEIFTPSTFRINLGQNHIKYESYHEIAYLHPRYYAPDSTILDELGFSPSDKFVIIRFVSWGAMHDFDHGGLNLEMKRLAVRAFSIFFNFVY